MGRARPLAFGLLLLVLTAVPATILWLRGRERFGDPPPAGWIPVRYRLGLAQRPANLSREEAIARTVRGAREHVSAMGVGKPCILVSPEGGEIQIDLPGSFEPRLRELDAMLARASPLEIRIAVDRSHPLYKRAETLPFGPIPGNARFRKVQMARPPGTKTTFPGADDEESWIVVDYGGAEGQDWLSGGAIESVEARFESAPWGPPGWQPGWVLSVRLDARGKKEMATVTGKNVDNQLAILLDGVCFSAPVVKGPMDRGHFIIEGLTGGEAEAKKLAALLAPGTIPVPLERER